MKHICSTSAVVILSLFMTSNSVSADTLGTLFTSEEERARLEYVRKQKPVVEKFITGAEEIDEVFDEVPVNEEIDVRDTLNLKGFVKRSDGKNSAWINDGNTYEGDLDTLYIKVNSDDINDDNVTINMPDNKTQVRLKVGEAYDPNSRQIISTTTSEN